MACTGSPGPRMQASAQAVALQAAGATAKAPLCIPHSDGGHSSPVGLKPTGPCVREFDKVHHNIGLRGDTSKKL